MKNRCLRRTALWLAILLTALTLFSGCGMLQEWVAPYEKELGELGGALFDVLLEPTDEATVSAETETGPPAIARDGSYTTKEDVARYLKTYGELPPNYLTKEEARALGWVSSKGNLHEVAPGKSIGGDVFGNYEGLLPKAAGRVYYECDIDYTGGTRGAKRIVFSNDGLIFYTDDHYESFTEIK